jgi:pyrroline-5-carboxylate reductase
MLAADAAGPASGPPATGSGDGAAWALQRMRAEVTSKGGTTEAAMKAFDAGGFQALVLAAMRAATDRGRELAAQFGSSS